MSTTEAIQDDLEETVARMRRLGITRLRFAHGLEVTLGPAPTPAASPVDPVETQRDADVKRQRDDDAQFGARLED